MPTISQKQLRNNVGEILRRVEAGEESRSPSPGDPSRSLARLADAAG
jgi:antitoxin (DNA-binding transcriptional repressor) of toxin-antitoxin stability system